MAGRGCKRLCSRRSCANQKKQESCAAVDAQAAQGTRHHSPRHDHRQLGSYAAAKERNHAWRRASVSQGPEQPRREFPPCRSTTGAKHEAVQVEPAMSALRFHPWARSPICFTVRATISPLPITKSFAKLPSKHGPRSPWQRLREIGLHTLRACNGKLRRRCPAPMTRTCFCLDSRTGSGSRKVAIPTSPPSDVADQGARTVCQRRGDDTQRRRQLLAR